jgi:hypothetical protein
MIASSEPATTLSYCSANFPLDEQVEPFGSVVRDCLDVPIGLVSSSRRHRAMKQSQTCWSSDRNASTDPLLPEIWI